MIDFKTHGRVLLALAAGVLILIGLNWSIFRQEQLIAEGRTMLLALAPVDPRSLMQGDYMALNFALANDIRSAIRHEGSSEGKVVVAIDENNVARFVRLDDEQTPLQAEEARLRYRVRDAFGGIKIATNAFFFEEGQGDVYGAARYGEFRVNAAGDAILTQLRDEKFNVLGRSAVLN